MKSTLSLKVPPPVVGLIAAGGMWAFSRLLPGLNTQAIVLTAIAYVIIAIGLLVEVLAVLQFVQHKTTINPLAPERSRTLVVKGLYRLTRNPMYLGMFLLLTGFCLWLGNPAGALMLVFFVWYLTKYQIKPEEEALLKIFGDQYSEYLNRVRRWC